MAGRFAGWAWPTIVLCVSGAAAQEPNNFDQCGELTQGAECVLLQADDESLWVLDDRGNFEIGDRVQVIGAADENCASICQQGNGCIRNNTIGRCFEGCGTLQHGPQGCPIFVPISEPFSNFLFIENTGSFGAGDLVWVQGCLNPESLLCAPFTAPGLEDNSIARCFAGCGTMVPTPIPNPSLNCVAAIAS